MVREHRRALAGTAVRDNPGKQGDAVGSEEQFRPVDETNYGDAPSSGSASVWER
jgi:hypothetical protein